MKDKNAFGESGDTSAMAELNGAQITCLNGHPSPIADARFCSVCAAPLTNMAAQQFTPQQFTSQQFTPQQVQPLSPQMYAAQAYQQSLGLPSPAPFNNYAHPDYGSMQMAMPYAKQCEHCGGAGQRLDQKIVTCKECGWLRPLAPGFAIDCSAFQFSEDGKAMSALRAISPLNALARAVSDKVGRRWVETAFNGVLLGENQLPDVYAQAVHAARITGMTHMPDIYVSGERMWDCLTFGSDDSAFILVGTALVTNFRGPDLLFLLAREMGHCRAGHALWKTVIRFLLGEQGPRKGLMSNGLLSALSPSALMEGALEMPLLAWARQAEITGDRAGLLAVGDEEVARRVLLSWTLKSPLLYRQINIAAWLEQQIAGDDHFTKLSELTTSSTPYITRRLNLLAEFARSPELKQWRTAIGKYAPPAPAPAASASVQELRPANPAGGKPTASQASGDMRMKCSACNTPMRVPSQVLAGKQQISIRCPNTQCGKVVTIKKKPSTAPTGNTMPAQALNQPAQAIIQNEGNLSDVNE
jgi:Zn-dependent protease with chaperone function